MNLNKGYYFVFETSTAELISHPNLSPFCSHVTCAEEGFSDSDVTALIHMGTKKPKSKNKNYYTATSVVFGTTKYTIVATVPSRDVE